MKVLITGATGFLGKAISRELLIRGHELIITSRDADKARESFPFPAQFVTWNPLAGPMASQSEEAMQALGTAEAVIHLTGEPVAARRWSDEQKKRILDSRILGTRHLWQSVAQLRDRGKSGTLKTLVAGSAIGFYGDREDTLLTESAAAGDGFLADVCKQWENEIFRPGFDEIRQVAVRTGVVLGQEGGALDKLLPIFKLGAGGPIGNGKQWLSWIHIDDIARIFVEAAENSVYRGAVNGVAPHPVTNADFGKTLGHVVERPALLPAPAIALKLAMGEMSHVVLDSQRVKPEKLSRAGFEFRYPELKAALVDLCAPQGEPADSQFIADQWIPKPVEEVFQFFSEAKNLEELTPPWLNFKIKKVSDGKLGSGSLIDYRLKVHGVPLIWRTRIDDWQPNRKFVDTQLKGPYTKWHHTHTFTAVKGGTLMQDRVLYRLPLGALGKSVAHWKVRQDIEQIFAFRRKRILELFAIAAPEKLKGKSKKSDLGKSAEKSKASDKTKNSEKSKPMSQL